VKRAYVFLFYQIVHSQLFSAIAAGDIIIRDQANQKQDVADLSRDTENAHTALDNNFDKDKIQDKLEIQQQATLLGTQAMTTYMDSKLDASKKKVRDEMAARGELNGLSETEIDTRVMNSAEFKAVDTQYGIGSPFWTASSAVTGLLAGVLGGNVQGGVAAGAAPVLARLVKEATGKDNEAARIALHTVISAALAKAQGGNATAGAIGGFIAFAGAERLAQALYVTAIGAAGGGVASGDTSGMVSAGNAARVEVENNFLSLNQLDGFVHRARNCSGASCEKVIRDMIGLNIKQQQEMAEVCSTSPQQCKQRYGYLIEQWPVFEAAIKRMAADGTLSGDFRDALAPIYSQSMEAEGFIASETWVQRFEAMGLNKEVSKAMVIVLPVLLEGTKGPKSPTSGIAGNNITNPAANKIVTEHIVVLSGKAPKTSTPNSVYEVSRVDGTKSITYYDSNGNMFSREDYGQQRTHGTLGYDSDGKVPPHEHKIEYNPDGKPIGKYYRELDHNGNAVGPWMHDK
jgi:filamentous hemagglutinin